MTTWHTIMAWEIIDGPDGFPVPQECAGEVFSMEPQFASEVEAWKYIEMEADAAHGRAWDEMNRIHAEYERRMAEASTNVSHASRTLGRANYALRRLRGET